MLKPGQEVIIRFNPHHSDIKDARGTVVELQPKAGFGGCDLALVRYRHPQSGHFYTLPLALFFLERVYPTGTSTAS